MLRRKAYDVLLEWKNDSSHKPLVIKGQRQVGKTYLVRTFASENYEHFVEFNFSLDEDVKYAFNGNLRVDDIIEGLSAYHNPNDFVPGKTLIFFDEIQDFPPAWTSLKSFAEDGRYDVIASGSRLGIEMNIERKGQKKLVPTGYQKIIELKVIDFEEYLWANGMTETQTNSVIECLKSRRQINPAIHKRVSSLFREYLITGGMPEIVQEYVTTKDVSKCHALLNDLLLMCHQDINRYNTGVDKIKTAECFDSIPAQLSETNKKFMYSRVKGEGSRRSAEKYMDNLLWIKYSNLGITCYAVTQPAVPLVSNRISNTFRMYLSDTGLLLHQYGLPAVAALRKEDYSYNCGAVIENQIAVCLDSCGFQIYFYRKNDGPGKMELDFLIESYSGLIAVEVKSGKTRDAPSIRKLPKFFKTDHRIMLEDAQYYLDDEGLEHFPLYAAAFFDKIWNQIPPEYNNIV